MSIKALQNIVLLAVVWVLILAGGIYVTIIRQPEELERVANAEKVERLKLTELQALETQHFSAAEQADGATRKWRARYKVIPSQLSSAEVIGYFNQLTASGFENFDITTGGTEKTDKYSAYAYKVEGRGYFSDLYRVVWELENNRFFYRINDLALNHIDLVEEDRDTGRKSMQVMVSFTMQVNAYFGGADGMSAPGAEGAALTAEGEYLPVSRAKSDLPPVPLHVLPAVRPAVNPFFPLIMQQLPPNTHGLVDVEQAQLVSIVGSEAVFLEGEMYRSVGLNEDVYLGQLVSIDPVEGLVKARLNKGGIIDDVEIYLQSGARQRQSVGTIHRAPAE